METDAKRDQAVALEAAIDALTRRLPHAGDDEIAELVSERKAMREELKALREEVAGNVVDLRGRRGG